MDKKSFENYSVEDFVTDESFLNYCHHSNKRDTIFWQQWLNENPSKKVLAAEASQIIKSLSLTVNEEEYREEYRKMEAAVNQKSTRRGIRFLYWNKTALSTGRKKRSISYIVAALLLIGITTFWLIPHTDSKAMALNHTINNGNKSLILTLSDSTTVTLLPNSSLDYPQTFQGANRQVYLKGEANFHVKRNEHFPFKVHAKDIVTTVLGTVFNIKQAGDSAIIVELLEGEVKVEIEDSTSITSIPILLRPNEKATYVFHDKFFYKNETTSSINFRQNTFDQIAARIKNVYGITVINNSDKKRWRFTGDFKNTTAKEIVENICVIKNLKSKAIGDTIFINNENLK
ncbi:MAG: FecR family protein [Bacteroidota bacterium]|nr:FecR family protein [Bacteroidota bacterium]